MQVGDPFMEKLLLEACLEAMKTGAIVGIQDMGAAGLTCSTCEMGARGGVGLDVELDLVPQRETGMSAYEIMLSESQERMLLVAEKGREDEVLRVFAKWGLDAVIVGTVEPEPRLRIRHHGELVADIPNQSLTDDAPLYHRPVGTWKAPVPLDPPEEVLAELAKDRDYTADLKKLLASANVCSKRWVHEQYDTMVQTNTVQGPGGEAGVMRIKGTGTCTATSAGWRWRSMATAAGAISIPKLGAMHAVAEAARKVACTGATPVAATNCLNFGNPEKPEIMAQLSAAIDGIAEACTALGTPITGGNVSLIQRDARRRHLSHAGAGHRRHSRRCDQGRAGELSAGGRCDPAAVAGSARRRPESESQSSARADCRSANIRFPRLSRQSRAEAQFRMRPTRKRSDELIAFGSSEYAKVVLGKLWGKPPALDLDAEADLHTLLRDWPIASWFTRRATSPTAASPWRWRRLHSQTDIGATVEQDPSLMAHPLFGLFAEPASTVLVTARREHVCSHREARRRIQLPRRAHRHHRRRPAGDLGRSRACSSRLPLPNCANLGPHASKPILHDEVTA